MVKNISSTDQVTKQFSKGGIEELRYPILCVPNWFFGMWDFLNLKAGIWCFKEKMGARFGIESMHGMRDFPYLTLGRTRKFIPPPWYKGGGGGGWNPSPEFSIFCSNLKRFYLQGKVFDLLNKTRYILGVVALLETSDVTNNGRYLGFLPRIRNQLKTARKDNFLCSINTHKQALCMILVRRFTFLVEKS